MPATQRNIWDYKNRFKADEHRFIDKEMDTKFFNDLVMPHSSELGK